MLPETLVVCDMVNVPAWVVAPPVWPIDAARSSEKALTAVCAPVA